MIVKAVDMLGEEFAPSDGVLMPNDKDLRLYTTSINIIDDGKIYFIFGHFSRKNFLYTRQLQRLLKISRMKIGNNNRYDITKDFLFNPIFEGDFCVFSTKDCLTRKNVLVVGRIIRFTEKRIILISKGKKYIKSPYHIVKVSEELVFVHGL